ncbi:hypothetical protein [Paenibacillus sp. FSL H3-0286]|uniref:hypothetical protein n=1 Tax=Paenibacillus sp. FSL H3-0286 TaxID=2921427 RepID=UPI00324F9CE5
MNKNFEIIQKLNELDECVAGMIKAFVGLTEDEKYNAAEEALIKTLKDVNELQNKNKYVPKAKVTSGIIYMNIIVEKVNTYSRLFRRESSKARSICTYIRDNLNGVTGHIKVDYEDQKNKMLRIEETIKEKIDSIYPEIGMYAYFFDAYPLSKSDFLGLFSFNRDKVRDDYSRVNYEGTKEAIADIPDIIDGNSFLYFAAGDSILLNNKHVSMFLMRKSFDVLEENGVDINRMFSRNHYNRIQVLSMNLGTSLTSH